jgi:serine/threonine protein kinase
MDTLPTGPLAKLAPGAPGDPAPFGPYLLYGLIARGGMAEVYRARLRDGTGPMLAIKVMRPQLAKEHRFVEMFIREGKLAKLLECPAIVRTFDVGEVEGRYFIAMEYIGGKDLTHILRRCQEVNQRIPVPHAITIAARICDGLHFAHTLTDSERRPLNIVNRDVSPANVRISYDGDVKVLDFGIAQAMLKFTSEIGVLKGKFSYMSPEQIRGLPVDARTDVFSTGIILHEMLTTEKLFRGDTEFALMEKVRKAEVPAPSKFNRRVTPALDAVALKALARDLPDRYQSAAEFGEALRGLLASYKFDPAEMKEFVRALFRQDYARELEEMKASAAGVSAMNANADESGEGSGEALLVIETTDADNAAAGPTPPVPAPVVPARPPAVAAPSSSPSERPAPAPQPPEPERGGGLWARLKNRLSTK